MSERMERVERWYLVDKFGPSTYGHATEGEAIAECTPGYRIIHLVELRENERIGVDLGIEKREPLVPEMSVADRIETSGERVEPVRTFKVGDRVRLLPGCVKDGVRESHVGAKGTIAGVVGTGFRLQIDHDEGAWYVNKENIEHIKTRLIPERKLNAAIERAEKLEVALRAAESALNDAAGKYEREQAGLLFAGLLASPDTNHQNDTDTSCLEIAIHGAKELRSHYFPPAKEVSNG